ncbi:MAG: DUF2339 domain-containing protein [Luteolibacter sp.]
MNPSEDHPLWNEIQRLRRELTDLKERNHAEIFRISRRITELESKVGQEAVQPPPLPKKTIIPERKAIPVEATLKPVSEPESAPEPAPTPEPKPEPVKSASVSEDIPDPVPKPASDRSFELDFGKVWFVRIGIVILLTGLVFLGNYAYQNWIREMPNSARLAALFACALALVETGRRLANKESLSRFGEVLLAGGMAFFYYCTFASHHVSRLKVIDSPVIAAVLLFAAAGAIAAVSWLRKTQATAILGIVLASYSTMLQPIGWMSCVSSTLLGGLGLFFMLRPGWSGPGWASMLGSYGAFLGWQLLGASGENVRTDDPATLWFLPPVWALFAIPGVVDRFRESLSERARAWFTAANNALFFLLFSAVWIHQNGDTDYWKVAAVFGCVLIALGVLGRRQNATAGGVNIGQGLAVATFAIILKLEGQHLALTLSFEALALALAAMKYRGKCEAVFSLLCGIGAVGIVFSESNLVAMNDVAVNIPIWSISLVTALITAASVVKARTKGFTGEFVNFLNASRVLLFVMAAGVMTQLCFMRLDQPNAILTAITLSGLLAVVTLRLDPKRLQPEIGWASLWFLAAACFLGFRTDQIWPLAIASVITLACCWLWHHLPEEEDMEAPISDLLKMPSIPSWVTSIALPILAIRISFVICDQYPDIFLTISIAAVVLLCSGLLLRCKRLLPVSTVLAFLALGFVVIPGEISSALLFTSCGLALASAAILHSPWAKKMEMGILGFISSTGLRFTAFIGYCIAWHRLAPGSWSDWLALTSIVLTVISLLLKRKLFAESVGLIVVSLIAFASATATSPWYLSPEQTGWRGITVVIALLSLVMTYRQRPALIENPELRNRAISIIAGLACVVTTVWATQMLVWRFGWKPSAVLWTVLGFAFVSTGLWQRLHILRVCGFLLLIVSFGKLFAVDVWDFTAFMRVVSFIVLGAALILLGLFYNKFAEAIKVLLDDERGEKE